MARDPYEVLEDRFVPVEGPRTLDENYEALEEGLLERDEAAQAELLKLRSQDETQKTANLQSLFDLTLRGPIDRRASVLEIARRTGVPQDIVDRRHDEFRQGLEAAEFDAGEFRRKSPGLAGLILDGFAGASVAQIAMRDRTLRRIRGEPADTFDAVGRAGSQRQISQAANQADIRGRAESPRPLEVGRAEAAVASFQDAFGNAAITQTKLSLLGFRKLMGGIFGSDTTHIDKERAEVERQIIPRQYEGVVPGAMADAGEIAGSLSVIATGAALGAGVALVAPVAVGAAAAASAGALLTGFVLETGGIFPELESTKTDDGRPIDPWAARGMAVGYGALSSLSERAQLGIALKTLGPLGDAIKARTGKAFAKELLRDSAVRSNAAILGKAFAASAKGAVAEGGQESFQTALDMASKWTAKTITAGEAQSVDVEAAVTELAEVFRKTVTGMGVLGLGAIPINVTTRIAVRKMKDEASLRSGQRVALITKLAQESPTAKASPELVAKLIEHETAESGEPVTHLYVDPQAFTRLFQENGADPDAAAVELLGQDGGTRLRDAVATDQMIEVPVAEYLEKWGTKPIAEALAEHVSTRIGYATTAQAREREATVQQEAERIADEVVPPDSAEGRFTDALQRQLRATGVTDAKQARTSVATWRAFIRTMAVEEGIPQDVLFDEYARTTIERAQEGQQPTAAAAQAQGRMEQAAFHGSPARGIERFDLGKVGSSTGKTHGWGIYFSGDRKEAEFYRGETATGQVYRAEIPEDDALLDYESAEQPPLVRQALDGARQRLTEAAHAWGMEDESIEHWLNVVAHGKGAEVYNAVAEMVSEKVDGSDEAASRFLGSIGIPGLRYLDPTANAKGRELPNYVIWDDSRVAVRETFYQDELAQGAARKIEDPRGFVEFAREGARRIFKITLNKNADLSTFLHESSHVFLEVMGDLAEREGASERLRQDWETSLAWLGVTSRKQITREHHEKWARAFEAYLLEGKAPSEQLARAFEAFKLWLMQVYRSIASLNVEMSDDIRGVFDRLLATDEEIARVHRAMGLDLSLTPEQLGIPPEQVPAMLEERERAAAATSRKVEFRVNKDRLREHETWWKDGLRAAREEAEAEYEALPARRAWRLLRMGEIRGEDGQVVAKVALPKLDRGAVTEAIGEAAAKSFTGTLVKADGVHPDDLAEIFGYPTGKVMLDAIVALPEKDAWTRERADALMRERHPEILDETEKLRELVAQGWHGEHTAVWLLREWDALRRRSGQTGSPPVEAIKRAAKLLAERATVRVLNASRYIQAERSAAEKAARAAAKGDFAQAYVFKQQQLLNHYLYRELEGARELRDSFESLASKLANDKSRARLGKAGPAYRDGVDQILEALGLREPEPRDVAPVSIEALVSALEQGGETIGFDSEPIAQLVAKPRDWRDLKVSELRNVDAALRNIRAAARNRNTVLVEGKRVDKAERVALLVADAEKNLERQKPVSSSVAAESLLESTLAMATEFGSSWVKIESLVDDLAGGNLKSSWYTDILLPIQRAKHREAAILKQVIKPLVDAFARMPKETLRRLNDKVDGETLFPDHNEDIQAPTRRFELLFVALHYGTDSSRQRLLDGRNITDAQVQAAIDLLTKEEIEWIQAVWNAFESLWEPSRALEERDSGLSPQKLALRPLVTRFGTYPGGYFPAVYDRRVEAVGERQAARELADLFDPTYTRPGTSHNHLKRRVENFSGVLTFDPTVIYAHLVQVAHDLAFRETIKSVGSLLLDPTVQQALKRRVGHAKAKVIVQWVKDVARMRGANITTHASGMMRFLRMMRSNFITARLGWRPDIATGDISNLAVATVGLVKARHLAAALSDFTASPKEMAAFAEERSGELLFRRDQLPRELQRQTKKLFARGPFQRGPFAWYKDHAFAFMEASDWATSTPVWLGAFRQSIAEGQSEADAIVYADKAIREIFPSHSAVDQAEILRDRGMIGFSTIFQGFWLVMWNRNRTLARQVIRAEGPIDKARAGGRLMGLWFAYSVLGDLFMFRPPNDDEEWAEWFVRKLMLAPLYAMPLPLAGLVEAKLTGRPVNIRQSPGWSFLETIFKAGDKLFSDAEAADKALALLKAIGIVFGYPVAPVETIERARRE